MANVEGQVMESPYIYQTETAGRGQKYCISPTLGILTYWQGIVELSLRIFSMVFVIAPLVAACISLQRINDLDNSVQDAINEGDDGEDDDDDRGTIPNLVDASRIDSIIVIALPPLIMVHEVAVIVFRVLHLNISQKRMIFLLSLNLCAYVLIAILLSIFGGVAGYFAGQWDQWEDYGSTETIIINFVPSPSVVEQEDDNPIIAVRDALIATCVVSYAHIAISYGPLGLWVGYSLSKKKWYTHPSERYDPNTDTVELIGQSQANQD